MKDEAVVLKSVQYRDHQRIITLLTRHHGIVSAHARRISQKDLKMHNLCSPLCYGEYILSKGAKDLYHLYDGHTIDTHHDVRGSFDHLSVACELLNLLARTQLPGKPSPPLFAMLLGYLNALKTSGEPHALELSFALKLLKHEGLYDSSKIPKELHPLAEVSHYTEVSSTPISFEQKKQYKKELLFTFFPS